MGFIFWASTRSEFKVHAVLFFFWTVIERFIIGARGLTLFTSQPVNLLSHSHTAPRKAARGWWAHKQNIQPV